MTISEDSRQFWQKQEEIGLQENIDRQLARIDGLLVELNVSIKSLQFNEYFDFDRAAQIQEKLQNLNETFADLIQKARLKDDEHGSH